MSEESTFTKRPSLLIGVGGTGLRIAREVRKILTEEGDADPMRLAFLGMDTDEKDIRWAEQGRDSFPVVWICPRMPFHDILKQLADRKKLPDHWPPIESFPYELLTRGCIDGAGQVRLLSSIAFYYTGSQGDEFERSLHGIQAELFAAKGHPDDAGYEGSLDVLIVGSIAGGTGSGTLLQSALLVRDWLKEHRVAATVRALLLLPNIFINGGLPVSQNDPVRANGYAALREIHAALQAITGKAGADYHFHYAPGRELKLWRPGQEAPQDRPFHSIILMDGFSLGGRPLGGGIAAYERMAADCAYQLLFTPLGVQHNSIHDNNVRGAIAQAAQNRSTAYAGMGISGLVYPLKEVEDYLGMRFAQTSLSEEWLLLDRLYANELAEFEARKRAGDPNAQQLPDRGESYVRTLNALAREGQPFFREIRNEVYRKVEDEQGVVSESQSHLDYLDALENHLMAEFWSDGELAKLNRSDFSAIRPEEMDDDELYTEIRNRERMIAKVREALDRRLEDEPRNQFISAWISAESTESAQRQPYHIQKPLFDGSAHPVKARYFLYSLRNLIRSRQSEARNNLTLNDGLLKGLNEQFDDKDTPHIIESPIDQVAEVMAASWMKRFLGGHVRAFKEQYASYYRNLMQGLKAKGDIKGRLTLYDLLEVQVGQLIQTNEQFFVSLAQLDEGLGEKIKKNAHRHSPGATGSDTNLYVLADAPAKEAIWERLKPSLSGSASTVDINTALLRGIYAAYKEAAKPRHSRFDKEPAPFDGRELFNKQVKEGYCRQQLRDKYSGSYQFHIAEAIALDARLRGRDEQKHLRDLAETVLNQAHPFLETTASAVNDVHLWTLTPKVHGALGGDAGVSLSLKGGRASTSFVSDNAFDDQRLNCFHFRLNLGAEDLSKFQQGGEYERVYRQVHDKLLREEQEGATPSVFTYHIHKDWHRPGVLPGFSSSEDRQLTQDALDAYLFGHALGLFDLREEDGRKRLYFNRRMLASDERPSTLLAGLIRNPVAVENLEKEKSYRCQDSQGTGAVIDALLQPGVLFQLLRLGLFDDSRKEAEPACDRLYTQLKALLAQQQPEARELDRLAAFKGKIEGLFQAIGSHQGFQSWDKTDREGLLGLAREALRPFTDDWQAEVDRRAREGLR